MPLCYNIAQEIIYAIIVKQLWHFHNVLGIIITTWKSQLLMFIPLKQKCFAKCFP